MNLRSMFAAAILILANGFSVNSFAKGIDEVTKAASLDDVSQMNKVITTQKKLDINGLDAEDMTPLMSAAAQGSLKTLNELIKNKKAKLEIQNAKGDTALAVAVQLDQVQAAEELIKAGANTDITVSGEEKDTLLIAAARSNYKLAKLILEKTPASLNKANANGKTALMESIIYGYNDTMRMLLEKGANRYAKTNDGKSVLDIAKDSQNKEAIKILTSKH